MGIPLPTIPSDAGSSLSFELERCGWHSITSRWVLALLSGAIWKDNAPFAFNGQLEMVTVELK
jgi:hypothetical protein